MIKINALNDGSLEYDSNSDDEPTLVATKEVLEEEARTLYREALQLQKEGKLSEAKDAFHKLLESATVKGASKRNEQEELSASPGLTLKYLAYKNLAAIAHEEGDDQATMETYLQAVAIDATDVSMWFKMGLVAQKLHNYVMARLFFLEGLQCNSSHWPCLDRVISVLYALNDYQNCLEHIAKALQKDPSYVKGLFFRDQIYREHPALRMETIYLFKLCDSSIYSETYEDEDVSKFLAECLAMREKRRELCKPKPFPLLTFRNAFNEFTWKCLGNNLVSLYDYIAASDPPLSIVCQIDLSQCSEGAEAAADGAALTSSVSSSSEACVSETPQSGVERDQSKSEGLPGEDVCMGTLQAESILLGEFCSRKVTKRKRLSTDSAEWNFKRRSTRVRNTSFKKPTEIVDYHQLLLKFLPSTLVGEAKDEDFEEGAELPVDVPATDHTYGQVLEEGRRELPESVDVLSRTENEDVKAFVESYKQNGGILQLMRHFLEELSKKSSLLWPSGLGDTYVSIYERLRKHIPHPNMFSEDSACESVGRQAWFTLVYDELKMDRWQLARRGAAHDFPGPFFAEDLDFLSYTSTRIDLLHDQLQNFAIRALWVKMKQHVIEGEVQVAVACLDRVDELLRPVENEEESLQIYLTNCLTGNFITASHTRELLDSLRRCQSLEEVHQLYAQEEYRTVADLLVPTFAQLPAKRQTKDDGSVPERQVQLLLLQDSLWKLGSYQECLYWGEAAFNEALQQYVARKDWGDTIVRLLEGLNNCLETSASSLSELEKEHQLRLTHNLIRLVTLQMEVAGAANCITPWIVLYRIVRHEEERLLKLAGPEETVGVLTSSLMLLLTAHECLGRRSWCSAAEGQLLLFIVDVLLEELQPSGKLHPHHEELEMGLEQCFYCLYGHPNKRTKARHLQEHNAPQIALTWNRAKQVFNYFKPTILPEFDSYRTSTVSSELEHLLRRISLLVPPEEDPNNITEAVVGYVEGGTDKHPTLFPGRPQPSTLVKEVFYLLGDYYFKNKEFGKAVKFYVLDVCSNPERLDSWAGMALSRSSQLEQRLTMGETKSDATVYRRASSALRCFRRALQLDPLHVALWIEYGSLAYMLHGYASRQLKQRKQLNLADDVVELLTNKKEEMLNTAEQCFRSANQCREGGELWLHHYMLGKIGEKRGLHPKDFLPQFTLAAQFLHEDGAAYPKRILYHGPPELSIEALEVYYRMHASVLKYMYGEDLKSLNFIKEYLRDVSQSPFACCLENRELFSSEDSSSMPASTNTKTVTADHDYLDDWQRKEDLAIRELLDWMVAKVGEKTLKESVRDNLQRLAKDGTHTDATDRDAAEIEERCLAAMEECHQRFAQHYKALYRQAHFYCHSRRHQDLQKSRDILLGVSQQPGLFAERKNTNFFNGIWRIPVDEIDRPGSFAVHMYRSIVLLIEVLRQQGDHGMLLNLTLQLSRTPEPGKRYLRDFDRLHLARESFTLCLGQLRGQMDRLLSEEPPPEESRLIECLLNIYRSWQTLQKHGVFPDEASEMLEEAYAMYKLGEVDTSPPLLEQAARFCQAQIQTAAGQSDMCQSNVSSH